MGGRVSLSEPHDRSAFGRRALRSDGRRDNRLGSPTATDLAVVPQEGLRTGNVHRESVMRVIAALVLGILFATTVASAWGIWIIETSEIR